MCIRDRIRGEAEKSWNHYLSKIEVEGDNADRITQFYTHLYRTMEQTEIYFISNQENKEVTVYPEFRVQRKQPELWKMCIRDSRGYPE